MSIVKGNFGGDGGPPTLDNVDLSNAKTLECDSCGCKAFKQTLMLKKLSSLISPTGQEAIVQLECLLVKLVVTLTKNLQKQI